MTWTRAAVAVITSIALASCASHVEVPRPLPAPAKAPASSPPPQAPPLPGPGTQGGAAAGPQTATPSAGTPAGSGKPAADGPPSATDSVFVFTPQQAVSAPPEAIRAAVPPAPTPSAPAAPQAAPPAPQEDRPSPPNGPLTLSVVASSPAIPAGGIVTMDVIASSDTAVVDAPFHLSFDPAIVEFVDGTPGDFLTQGGSSIVFFTDGRSRPGDVAVAAGRVDRGQGARGAGLLCRVRLRGIGAGTTRVIVGQAKAWGTGGQELPIQTAGTSVAVQ